MHFQPISKLLVGTLLMLFTSSVFSTELTMDISYVESSKGLQVSGETNVPNGTKIGISVDGNGYGAQDFDVFVQDGKFISTYFTNRGKKLAGNFQINVFIYESKIWQKQPEILTALSAYESDLFETNRIGDRKFEKSRSITVGTSQEIASSSNQAALETDHFNQLAKVAVDLLKQGKNMDGLRNRNRAQECGVLMRQLQPRVDTLQSQVEQLPRDQNKFLLGAASSVLHLCVSCSESLAMNNCREAEGYLKEAEIL